jgi:glycosyltransferase involved in cell wall biosynthesis
MPSNPERFPSEVPGVKLDDKALRLPAPLYKPIQLTFPYRYNAFSQAIQEIIQQHPNHGPLIIFPPSLDWHSQLFQRPQQLALAMARQGALIFYVQPVRSYRQPGIEKIQERLYLCKIPVGSFWFLKNPIIYLLTWNAKYSAAFDHPQVIYDFVDELGAFEGKQTQILRQHDRLLRNADWVVATAMRLYQQVLPIRPDVLLCPNGVDYDFIVQAKQPQPVPADLAAILGQGKPIIGYYGALAHWFDFNLLTQVAKIRRDLSFVLIGPDTDKSLRKSRASDLPNIFWLGVKAYDKIPQYLHYFDAAIIPFCLNEVSHATSPIKLFEYMAGGKPAVITAMEESKRYPGVLVAIDAPDFSNKLTVALQLKSDPQYLQEIDQVAREYTWDKHAQQILQALAEKTRPD